MEPRPRRSAIPTHALVLPATLPAIRPASCPPEVDPLDIAAVLLVLEAGLGLISAAGVVFLAVLSGGSPLYLAAALVAIAGPALAILLARGLSRGRRWARNGAIAYEALILLGAIVRVVFLREIAFGLIVTLTGVVLPLTVCALVLSPSARRATSTLRRLTPNA